MTTRIGIMGYGNLGKGIEAAIKQNPDLELAAVFTRRSPGNLKIATPGVPVYSASQAVSLAGDIDVLILCGGSATDLPVQTPIYAQYFNVVDSFDTHAKIPGHFNCVNEAAAKAGKTAVISAGWDPGLFSVNRVYAEAVQPEGKSYTFWGRGVSQGHSDALRRIKGVVDARQYTVPVSSTAAAARRGDGKDYTAREMHTRECYVVVENGVDKAAIEREIKAMPNYFSDYDVTVHFISQEELDRDHSGLPHGGFVVRSSVTGLERNTKNSIEYRLSLGSNPEFTSSVLCAVARACVRMNREGLTGCKTMLDIPPAYLSAKSREELIGTML